MRALCRLNTATATAVERLDKLAVPEAEAQVDQGTTEPQPEEAAQSAPVAAEPQAGCGAASVGVRPQTV